MTNHPTQTPHYKQQQHWTTNLSKWSPPISHDINVLGRQLASTIETGGIDSQRREVARVKD